MKGRVLQEKHRPRDGTFETFSSGTHRSGTDCHIILCLNLFPCHLQYLLSPILLPHPTQLLGIYVSKVGFHDLLYKASQQRYIVQPMFTIKTEGFFCMYFIQQSASSAAPQISLCGKILLESNPGQLRLRHWQSDALTNSG